MTLNLINKIKNPENLEKCFKLLQNSNKNELKKP